MRGIRYNLLLNLWLMFFPALFASCANSDKPLPVEEEEDVKKEEQIVEPVTGLTAKVTDKANELKIEWNNPEGIVSVEISYLLEGDVEGNSVIDHVKVFGEKKSLHLLVLPNYGTYQIGATAIDNYGKRSEKVTITATPAKEDVPPSYEIINQKLPIADPYVLYHNGKYHAYGTRIDGFEVYISDDLKHWRRNENLALSPGNSWGTRWYWAPEVYYIESKNRFYMFYTVDEHLCVATSGSPEGFFVQDVKKPIIENEKAIDSSLFIDDDGTPYLFFVRFTGGNVIWVAEMNEDLKSIKTGTMTKCISADEPWERIQSTVAEGPSMIKWNDTYYLIYSANHYQSQDYAVGYATSDSPLGPWKKYSGNPILRRDKPAAAGLAGTGHGAPFICADGSYKYIYHAHGSITSVGSRTSFINDLIISEEGVISIGGETIRPVVVK